MPRYLARIGGVPTWVGPDDALDVGVLEHGAVSWYGPKTWAEIEPFCWAMTLKNDGRRLVTNGQAGELLDVSCTTLHDEPDDDAPLSSHEAQLIVRVLEETGQGELARRIAPILDRCTKTDPPPALELELAAAAAVKRA